MDLGTLVGISFTLLICFLVFRQLRSILRLYAQAKARLLWPSVKGTIVVSSYKIVRTLVDNEAGLTHAVEFQYRYFVNGQEYFGSTIGAGSPTALVSESAAYDIVALYPVGRKVRVYYSPADTATAVLEPGLTVKDKLGIIAVGVFLVALAVGALQMVWPTLLTVIGLE